MKISRPPFWVLYEQKISPHIPHARTLNAYHHTHTHTIIMSAIAQITNRCVSVASVSRKTHAKRVAQPVRRGISNARFPFFLRADGITLSLWFPFSSRGGSGGNRREIKCVARNRAWSLRKGEKTIKMSKSVRLERYCARMRADNVSSAFAWTLVVGYLSPPLRLIFSFPRKIGGGGRLCVFFR